MEGEGGGGGIKGVDKVGGWGVREVGEEGGGGGGRGEEEVGSRGGGRERRRRKLHNLKRGHQP